MTAVQFCYWLQGKLEIDGEPQPLSPQQVKTIAKHLNMVFAHDIDPQAGGLQVQKKLNVIHNSGPDKDVVYRC